MFKKFKAPKTQDRGAALVEYGMLAGLIAVVSIAAVNELGNEVNDTFVAIESTLEGNLDVAIGGTGGTGGGTGGGGTGSNPAWTDVSSYPSGADCTQVADGGAYDPNFTCFLFDVSYEDEVDFTTVSGGPLTFRAYGFEPTQGGASAAITPPSTGGTLIATIDPGSWMWYDTTAGNDYVLFPTRNCSDIDLVNAGMGILSLDFTDGTRVITYTDLEGIYCAGDDTTWDNAYIQANMRSQGYF